MKVTLNISLLVLSVFFGCSTKTSNSTDWDKIKDSKSFESFFNFAISTSNNHLLNICIDSVEKYKPENEFDFLRYSEYWDRNTDSMVIRQFYIEDGNERMMKIKDRNIIFISIDENDSIWAYYKYCEYRNYTRVIEILHDTTGDSYNLPVRREVQFDNKTYYERVLGAFIFSEILPDSLTNKTSWKGLINLTKDLLLTYREIKDKKAHSIFNRKYSSLEEDKKLLIDRLVPIFIDIYFDGAFEIKWPPPPPKKELDSLTMIGESELNTGANRGE